MKVFYDLHIHSALSPCADDDMTPASIVAMAEAKGLSVIAVSDHNGIKNVEAAMECGKDFGIIVIPAMEVQSSEDIHILTLFYDFKNLERFYNSLTKRNIKNKEDIYGRQLIINADDVIVGKEENLLLVGVEQNIYEVVKSVKKYGGVAIPAHIDREENGIVAILGGIPEDLEVLALEFSKYADEKYISGYIGYKFIRNSDAHRLIDISEAKNAIETKDLSIKGIIDSIKGGVDGHSEGSRTKS